MKGRSTLNIFICILLIGAFIWFQESWRAKNPTKSIERIRLFNLDINTLLSVEFNLTNGVIKCIKENGIWMAGDKEGNMGRADDALVQRMVSGLNSMGKGTTITGKHLEVRGLDAAEYGFETPTVTITAIDNQGRQVWMVGRKTPLGDMVYAKNAGKEAIYTVPGELLVVVPKSHDVLRDRVLFSGDAASVRRIEIRGSAGYMQLIKDPQSGWRLQQPVAAQAEAKEVEGFVEKLYHFYIEDFIADNVSDFSVYGLQGETRQISVGSGDGSSRMLIIGDDIADKSGYVYARRADDTSVFTLPADVLTLLNVPADRFRDANVLSVPMSKVSSITVSRGEEDLSLSRSEANKWTLISPVVWDANEQAVADLLMLWDNAVITEFNITTEASAPEWIFEFGSLEEGVTNQISVLPAAGSKDGLLIKRDDDPNYYQINLPLIPAGIIDPLEYKDRQIWKLEKAAVDKVTLLTDAPSRQVVERQDDRSFSLVETNSNFHVNERLFDRLLNQLELVMATDYITYNPRDLEIYGLVNPSTELQVSLSGSNELGRVLLIGRETPDGFYSMVKGRDVIFYLDKDLVSKLNVNLTESPEPVRSITE